MVDCPVTIDSTAEAKAAELLSRSGSSHVEAKRADSKVMLRDDRLCFWESKSRLAGESPVILEAKLTTLGPVSITMAFRAACSLRAELSIAKLQTEADVF